MYLFVFVSQSVLSHGSRSSVDKHVPCSELALSDRRAAERSSDTIFRAKTERSNR